jgi:carboxyl-terminal processing protease
MGKESTLAEIKKTLAGFKEKKMQGLIMDLRSNPGGLLDMAIELCDIFIPVGKDIVSVKGRGEKLVRVYKATSNGDKYTEIPLIVLLNNGSASASEIFGGAMQDHKRAKIIGTQSFGKGSVQNIYPLSHKTGMALTIQKYYTPNGISIHKKGITPDEVVNPITPDDDEKFILDKIAKANLLPTFVKENPGYSEANIQGFQALLLKKGFKLRDELTKLILKREYQIGEKAPIYDREFDIQLNRAVELLTNK